MALTFAFSMLIFIVIVIGIVIVVKGSKDINTKTKGDATITSIIKLGENVECNQDLLDRIQALDLGDTITCGTVSSRFTIERAEQTPVRHTIEITQKIKSTDHINRKYIKRKNDEIKAAVGDKLGNEIKIVSKASGVDVTNSMKEDLAKEIDDEIENLVTMASKMNIRSDQLQNLLKGEDIAETTFDEILASPMLSDILPMMDADGKMRQMAKGILSKKPKDWIDLLITKMKEENPSDIPPNDEIEIFKKSLLSLITCLSQDIKAKCGVKFVNTLPDKVLLDAMGELHSADQLDMGAQDFPIMGLDETDVPLDTVDHSDMGVMSSVAADDTNILIENLGTEFDPHRLTETVDMDESGL